MATSIDQALGIHIRERRRGLGMSQVALADSVSLTFQQIQKYERGYNRVSFSTLVELAHALQCEAADLVGDLDLVDGEAAAFRKQTAYLGVDGAPALALAYGVLPEPLQQAVLDLLVQIAKTHRTKAKV